MNPLSLLVIYFKIFSSGKKKKKATKGGHKEGDQFFCFFVCLFWKQISVA